MGRLRRFPDHRHIGDRGSMRFYDCDEESEFAELQERAELLADANLLQTFGPDTPEEAANRGFSPLPGRARQGR